jgi:NAD(P)-dependent dehydrogenase (short-subunit alcohol dehydrogenase family)
MANGRLQAKVALVTGIGAGIGKGCALRFAREGATVIGCDINAAWAEATCKEAADEGLSITSLHPIDLTSRTDVSRLVDVASAASGRIDVVVNAAAINPKFAPIDELSYDDIWTPTLRGEADLVFLLTQAAWPWLKKSGNASVITFASVVAFRGTAVAGMLAHVAGKGAVLSMTRQLALEGAAHGIRVNSIAPGLVVTHATTSAGMTEGDARRHIESTTPLGRLGTADDVAWGAVYLASDESSWVTGVNLPIDGGTLAM